MIILKEVTLLMDHAEQKFIKKVTEVISHEAVTPIKCIMGLAEHELERISSKS